MDSALLIIGMGGSTWTQLQSGDVLVGSIQHQDIPRFAFAAQTDSCLPAAVNEWWRESGIKMLTVLSDMRPRLWGIQLAGCPQAARGVVFVGKSSRNMDQLDQLLRNFRRRGKSPQERSWLVAAGGCPFGRVSDDVRSSGSDGGRSGSSRCWRRAGLSYSASARSGCGGGLTTTIRDRMVVKRGIQALRLA